MHISRDDHCVCNVLCGDAIRENCCKYKRIPAPFFEEPLLPQAVTAVASASHICATGGTCTFRLERKYSQLQPKQLTDSRLQSTQNAAGNASRRMKRRERRKEVEWWRKCYEGPRLWHIEEKEALGALIVGNGRSTAAGKVTGLLSPSPHTHLLLYPLLLILS